MIFKHGSDWTYGAGGHTIKALLSFDRDSGAIRSFQLGFEIRYSVSSASSCSSIFTLRSSNLALYGRNPY